MLGVVALAALLVLIAWFGLHRRCAHGSNGGGVAWAAIASLLLLSLLAAASVSPFLLPAGLLLAAAAPTDPSKLTPAKARSPLHRLLTVKAVAEAFRSAQIARCHIPAGASAAVRSGGSAQSGARQDWARVFAG